MDWFTLHFLEVSIFYLLGHPTVQRFVRLHGGTDRPSSKLVIKVNHFCFTAWYRLYKSRALPLDDVNAYPLRQGMLKQCSQIIPQNPSISNR